MADLTLSRPADAPGAALAATALDTLDKASELVGKAEALCLLCRMQMGGEAGVPNQRAAWRWTSATIERMLALIRDADALDVSLDASTAIHDARAQAEIIVSDLMLGSGDAPHLNEDVIGWALWSLSDDLRRAKLAVDGTSHG